MTDTPTPSYDDDRHFLDWLEKRAAEPGALFTRDQVKRFIALYGGNPEVFTLDDLNPLDSERIAPGLHEARRLLVPYDDLDPGIRGVVRWLVFEGFHTTDSGDGVSKPQEARVFDFPHVVLRVRNHNDLIHEARRLRELLEGRALEVGPQGPDGSSIAIEAAWDVGADVATILLSGVSDQVAGFDRHWTGTRCGIPSDLDTADYVLGDQEPCVLCDDDTCVARVVPGPCPKKPTEPFEKGTPILHRRRDLFGVVQAVDREASQGPSVLVKWEWPPQAEPEWVLLSEVCEWPWDPQAEPEWVLLSEVEHRAPFPGDDG